MLVDQMIQIQLLKQGAMKMIQIEEKHVFVSRVQTITTIDIADAEGACASTIDTILMRLGLGLGVSMTLTVVFFYLNIMFMIRR